MTTKHMEARMLGARVRVAGFGDGTIELWEPYGAGHTDTLVVADDGRRCWFASYALTAIDDKGPLVARRDALALRREEMTTSLAAIRARHVAEWRKAWPGAEHGKAIIGRAIDGALADVTAAALNAKLGGSNT